MESKNTIVIWLLWIGVLLAIYTNIATGSQDFNSERCVTKGVSNYPQYVLCTEDGDSDIYPGVIKTLIQELYIPNGLTRTASISITAPANRPVIISKAYLAFQDGVLTMTKTEYKPETTSGKSVSVVTNAVYIFGDMNCDINPCAYCLVKLAVEYLMFDIQGVSDGDTSMVNIAFISDNETMEVLPTFVLRTIHNTTNNVNLLTDIPDLVDFTAGSVKSFHLDAMFRNPLSTYDLVLQSPDAHLRIASVRVQSVGEHLIDFIPIKTGPSPDDGLFCLDGPDTRTLHFGYLPNKGAYGPTTKSADTVTMEVILVMTDQATPGQMYSLDVRLEVDFLVTNFTTKYFKATELIPLTDILVRTTQKSPSLPKSGSGSVTLIWEVPPFTSGLYKLNTSIRQYAGPGSGGMMVTQIESTVVGSNLPCIFPFACFKGDHQCGFNISNIPYTTGREVANRFGVTLAVVVLPDIAEANSIHEMNVTLTFPGKSSSQSFQFFFNVTDQEIFEIPDCIKFMEACPSVTASTKLYLKMHTESDKSYGRMLVEMPMPTESAGQAFMLCAFGEIIEGRGVSSRRNTIITRRDDGMIGKVHDEFTTLIDSSVHNGKVNSHHVKLVMIVTYINDSLHINNSPLHFEASIVSNNVTVWRGKIPIHRPAIEYYPDFIVLTEITKAADVNPSNLAYLYSQNGSYYHREAVVWNKGSDVYRLEFPKVIAYFSFSASPCDVICGVTAVWSPLLDYVTIVNDDNKVMLRMLPYALDQDLNTCFDLPVPGDFPSMLWLRIKNMSLFGVTSQKFVVHAIGEGIECTRIGQKSIQVGTSKPADSNNGSFDSYVEFCKIVSHNSAATITYCDIECVCNDCSYVDIVMQSANTKPWRLCELTPEDVIQSKRRES